MIFATASEITIDKQWVYRYFPMADDELLAILQALEDLHVKKLGILYQNDEYGRDVSNEVATKFENSERIVSKEPFEILELDVIDFKENIAKLQNEDAIYVIAFPDYIEIILIQLRESNYAGEILTPLDASVFKIINMPEANGVYLTAPIIYDSNFIFARTVSENFESRYNKQFDFNAANGYDLIRILGGLLQNEELSRDNVKRIFDEGFIYSGVFGSVDVLPGEHDIAFGLYPSKVVDGKLEFRR
jgi:ABC-type branched-subunit amino acid transport system substrate-binding protein